MKAVAAFRAEASKEPVKHETAPLLGASGPVERVSTWACHLE